MWRGRCFVFTLCALCCNLPKVPWTLNQCRRATWQTQPCFTSSLIDSAALCGSVGAECRSTGCLWIFVCLLVCIMLLRLREIGWVAIAITRTADIDIPLAAGAEAGVFKVSALNSKPAKLYLRYGRSREREKETSGDGWVGVRGASTGVRQRYRDRERRDGGVHERNVEIQRQKKDEERKRGRASRRGEKTSRREERRTLVGFLEVKLLRSLWRPLTVFSLCILGRMQTHAGKQMDAEGAVAPRTDWQTVKMSGWKTEQIGADEEQKGSTT